MLDTWSVEQLRGAAMVTVFITAASLPIFTARDLTASSKTYRRVVATALLAWAVGSAGLLTTTLELSTRDTGTPAPAQHRPIDRTPRDSAQNAQGDAPPEVCGYRLADDPLSAAPALDFCKDDN